MFSVAIVGRPNVGKSTLFNLLAGQKIAIVHSQPGATRDYQEAIVSLEDELQFKILDTPGLADPYTEEFNPIIAQSMQQQTIYAMTISDRIWLVIDGAQGITRADEEIARLIRRHNKPVTIIVNKSDLDKFLAHAEEFYNLGFKDIIYISASQGQGIEELYKSIMPFLSKDEVATKDKIAKDLRIKLTFIGKPNVGKSTIINALLGFKRLLTADFHGVTRDATHSIWEYQDHKTELIDTAGIKRNLVNGNLEAIALKDAKRTLILCDMAVLVLDATSLSKSSPIASSDLALASNIIKEGRALVIALNKSDQVADIKQIIEVLKQQLDYKLVQGKGVAVIAISAIIPSNLDKLMQAVIDTNCLWNQRIQTAKLNKWLPKVLTDHPPPIINGTRIRIKYITQIKSRPPTFALFTTKSFAMPENYLRYLTNRMREEFNLPGIPIRLQLKQTDNPYAMLHKI